MNRHLIGGAKDRKSEGSSIEWRKKPKKAFLRRLRLIDSHYNGVVVAGSREACRAHSRDISS